MILLNTVREISRGVKVEKFSKVSEHVQKAKMFAKYISRADPIFSPIHEEVFELLNFLCGQFNQKI